MNNIILLDFGRSPRWLPVCLPCRQRPQAELLANQQTERFSARLIGAEEVPPINTAGTADFQMTIQQGTITF